MLVWERLKFAFSIKNKDIRKKVLLTETVTHITRKDLHGLDTSYPEWRKYNQSASKILITCWFVGGDDLTGALHDL